MQATLPNADGTIKSGMSFSVDMAFTGETFPNVDPLSIQWSNKGAYVWKVVDGKVVKGMVEIVQRNSDGVLVKGDVKQGDQIVTQGVLQLTDGATIRLLDNEHRRGSAWPGAAQRKRRAVPRRQPAQAQTAPSAPAQAKASGRRAKRRQRLVRSGGRRLMDKPVDRPRALAQAQTQQGAKLAGLFVRRPVLAVVINALIVVGGLAAFLGVEVRELPEVDQPVLTINTTFDGASADTIDKEITSTIEGAVARVQGVIGISSSSSYGRSQVTLTLADGTNLDSATSDVRDATARLINKFPDGVDAPTIVKADPNAQAIMQLSVTSDTMSRDDLTTLVDNQISEALAAVPGVADLQIYGEQAKVFTIDVDQNKLAAVGLTVGNIQTALASIAFDTAAGTINGANQNITVRATADVTTPEQFENIIIDGKTRLGDVAKVVFGPQNSSSGLHSDGKSGIGIGIIRAAESNTVQISDGVYKAVAQLQQALPKAVSIKVSSDDSIFISGALHEVERSLALSVGIVIAVIFLFLMDWRATLVPAISMPVALIGSIAGIYIAGFSINILTLLAIVLATGLVVDDSIVVLENIVRRRGMGAGPRAAAVLGTQEVFFAVLATTATLIAVFVPLSFLPGQTGRLFREFGFTLAICVVLSCVVALSLGPMLASRFLKEHHDMGHHIHRDPIAGLGRFFAGLYRGCCASASIRRWSSSSSRCCSPARRCSSSAPSVRNSRHLKTVPRSRSASRRRRLSASISPRPRCRRSRIWCSRWSNPAKSNRCSRCPASAPTPRAASSR